jgi:DNA-binding NarL/FixJ family response regulator
VQRLLLVEHNPYFREGLALLLEWRTGLSSIHAGSLAEAKSVLEDANQMPVCVLVDLDLPDGDGTELLKQLDGVPVLALSRSRNLELQAEAIGVGADEVVSTKGPVEEIVAAVERLIGQACAQSSFGEAKKYTGRLLWSRP